VKQRVLLRGITMVWILRELTLLKDAGESGMIFMAAAADFPTTSTACHEVT